MKTSLVPATTAPVSLDRVAFKVGDIVTRDGTDRHRVIDITEGWDGMTVLCIKEPASGWCKVGDEEYNLCRRYEFAGDVIEG